MNSEQLLYTPVQIEDLAHEFHGRDAPLHLVARAVPLQARLELNDDGLMEVEGTPLPAPLQAPAKAIYDRRAELGTLPLTGRNLRLEVLAPKSGNIVKEMNHWGKKRALIVKNEFGKMRACVEGHGELNMVERIACELLPVTQGAVYEGYTHREGDGGNARWFYVPVKEIFFSEEALDLGFGFRYKDLPDSYLEQAAVYITERKAKKEKEELLAEIRKQAPIVKAEEAAAEEGINALLAGGKITLDVAGAHIGGEEE